MKIPTLSVVVPTKNRYNCLTQLVSVFNQFHDPTVEFVIQDNSDDNTEFLRFVTQLKDDRIKYYFESDWLSVNDNCELGISNSCGRYVCLIGDDDGVMPWIGTVANWLNEEGLDALVCELPHYMWPDTSHKYWGRESEGSLLVRRPTATVSWIDVQLEKKRISRSGGTCVGNCPGVYHGIVRRSLLDELKSTTGTFFPGPSPDMANAVGLSLFVDRAVHIDFPVVITGNCSKSTGGQGARHEHHGRVSKKLFLPKGTEADWSRGNPLFWSASTIWAESAIKAFEATGQSKSLSEFNYSYLYAHALVFQHRYYREVFAAMPARCIPLTIAYMISLFVRRTSKLVSNILTRRLKVKWRRYFCEENVSDIRTAVELLRNRFGADNVPWAHRQAPAAADE